MKRDSCTTPWQNRMDLSVRQSLPQVRGQAMTVELDIVNFSNALGLMLNHVDGRDREWGKIYGATITAESPADGACAGCAHAGADQSVDAECSRSTAA